MFVGNKDVHTLLVGLLVDAAATIMSTLSSEHVPSLVSNNGGCS